MLLFFNHTHNNCESKFFKDVPNYNDENYVEYDNYGRNYSHYSDDDEDEQIIIIIIITIG